MMRKIHLLLAAAVAAILAASCNKEASTSEPALPQEDGKVLVSVQAAPGSVRMGTRAAGDAVADTPAERTINTLDVFFINSASKALDAYAGTFTQLPQTSATADPADETGATTVDPVKVSNAKMDIWVIANAPATLKGAVKDEATLLAAVSEFTQNTAGNFVMVGRKMNVDLPAATATKTDGLQLVTRNSVEYRVVDGIVLERVANKVTIAKITKAFDSPALQASEITLEGMYIINAPKTAVYAAKLAAGKDLAPAAEDASYWNPSSTFADNALITKTYATPIAIAAGDGTELGNAFYFYPNPAAEAASAAEEDYVTKLVLKVGIDGKSYWYPIGITQAAEDARNLVYEIAGITLRGKGNDTDTNDPNDYISRANIEVQLTVKDWVSAEPVGSYNDWMNE